MTLFQRFIALLLIGLGGLSVPGLNAQESAEASLPTSHILQNVRYEPQGWNNCGPATLTNGLTYFGYTDNQTRAASWLKPNGEDKNVSPWQMAHFVNQQVNEVPVGAIVRSGGDLQLLKRLIANDFPVIIEKGYDPEPDRLGWMGHYLLMIGYDDSVDVFVTHDSYIGPSVNYSYDYIADFWQHFNYTYIVLFPLNREFELRELLGSDWDETQNTQNALALARAEATADNNDAYAWFNMGTNFLALGQYQEAAIAYDQARNIGLPWRMLWYQFGPFEAYYQVERYDDMIALARGLQSDGGGHLIEETRYYLGLARQGRGELDLALENFNASLAFNPNFTPAIEARARLLDELNANG